MTKLPHQLDPATLTEADLARHANRLLLLAKDTEKVCEYLDTLFEVWQDGRDTKGLLHDALMTSAVVVYARSFVGNRVPNREATERAAFTLLPVSKIDTFRELHEQIITARKKAIAHSDWSHRTTHVIETGLQGTLRSSSLAAGWEGIPERRFRELAYRVWDEARQLVGRIDRGEHPFQNKPDTEE